MESNLLAKAVGALGGTILSLVLLKPVNIRDALSRIAFCLGCSYFFSDTVKKIGDFPDIMSASAFTALISWFLAGFVVHSLIKLDVVNLIQLLREIKR